MVLSISIFLITILLIMIQPKGINIGTSAILGAFFAFILGVVDLSDVFTVTKIVWDATLSFLGIIIFSMVLNEIGFFEWCAIKMAKISNSNGNLMFIYSLLLGSFISAIFANDGAALILTPILLAKMKILKLDMKTIVAFLLAGGFISDSASLPFVFSNLTNIVTANYFGIGFLEYLLNMFIPFIVSILVSILFLWVILRKDIPKRVNTNLLKNPNDVLKSKKLFRFSWLFLTVLIIGYFVGDRYDLPISVFALGGGLVFLIIATMSKNVDPIKIIKNTPWQIIWFSIGLYIVVYGLKNAGLTDVITSIIEDLQRRGDFVAVMGTGFLSAFLSSIMNNMPTIMIMNISLTDIQNSSLIYANIIGSNIGPKMTPFGSLATLLWLHVLSQNGVKITFWKYTKFGLIVTPPVLFLVLLTLI